jgi:plastocyanin
MKTRAFHKVMVVAGGVAIALAAFGVAAEAPRAVSIQLFQFRPGQAEVAKGAAVTWTNQDDITHTVTSGTPDKRDGRFSAPLAGKGATTTVEFKEPGVYPYFCERHQSMRGEIRVP